MEHRAYTYGVTRFWRNTRLTRSHALLEEYPSHTESRAFGAQVQSRGFDRNTKHPKIVGGVYGPRTPMFAAKIHIPMSQGTRFDKPS